MRVVTIFAAAALLAAPALAQDAATQYAAGHQAWTQAAPDYAKACDALSRAAAQGHARAAFELANLYAGVENFACTPKAPDALFALYKQAADGGVTEADADIGMAYATGSGVNADPAQMLAWYRKGAAANDARSERLLGEALRYGIGAGRDIPQAISWLNKAAASDAEAEAQLAAIYYDGDGVTPDYAQAYKWAQKAAQGGSAEGAYYVGQAQENGRGTRQDYDAALTSYGAAYEQGHDGRPLARIGVMLCNGWGAPQDQAGGLQALHAAATPATPEAFFAIGDLYEEGRCVTKDIARAFAWKRLGILFRDGDVDTWPAELKTLSDQMTADQKAGINATTSEVAGEVGMSVDVSQ